MLFYYIVIETIDGIKQNPIILDDTELKNKIEELGHNAHTSQYSIVTEKAGWYRIHYNNKKNYLRYKRSV